MKIQKVSSITDPAIIAELKLLPNQGVLWEILQSQITGKIYQLPDNVFIIIENYKDPFVFIAGKLAIDSVKIISDLLNPHRAPMICCSKKYHGLFLDNNWKSYQRAQLDLKEDVFPKFKKPQNTSLCRIDSLDLFQQCFWYKQRSKIYGSELNFISLGLGYALLLNDKTLVSEAYASIGGGYAEIGVVTHPNYQRKGYATLVASHMCKVCLEKNLIPQWSCSKSNLSSIKTSLKLGFKLTKYDTLIIPTTVTIP